MPGLLPSTKGGLPARAGLIPARGCSQGGLQFRNCNELGLWRRDVAWHTDLSVSLSLTASGRPGQCGHPEDAVFEPAATACDGFMGGDHILRSNFPQVLPHIWDTALPGGQVICANGAFSIVEQFYGYKADLACDSTHVHIIISTLLDSHAVSWIRSVPFPTSEETIRSGVAVIGQQGGILSTYCQWGSEVNYSF